MGEHSRTSPRNPDVLCHNGRVARPRESRPAVHIAPSAFISAVLDGDGTHTGMALPALICIQITPVVLDDAHASGELSIDRARTVPATESGRIDE
eukprot:scaffold102403_cov71-Phaeocystis_antarctica.AAC.4